MERIISSAFVALIPTHKIILVSGPKNTGKPAFMEAALSKYKNKHQKIELGEERIREEINKLSLAELLWLGNQSDHMLLCECEHLVLLQEFLDEVLNGKVNASIMLTASTQPKIEEELLEALAYQGAHFYLPPPTFYEYTIETSLPIESKGIDQRLIYGNYHSLNTQKIVKEEGLNETINKIVEANFSASNRINKSAVLLLTIQVLANHIGQPISYNQIATFIGVDNETIERYISLLCQSHVLYRLPTYSTDKKYELKKTNIFIFLDNGIRNASINNFNDLLMRMDIDALWMNWLIAERIKWNKMNMVVAEYFFWRSHTRQQVDFIECNAKGMQGYKFKYNKKKPLKKPPLFQNHYPDIPVHTVNTGTYFSFLSKR